MELIGYSSKVKRIRRQDKGWMDINNRWKGLFRGKQLTGIGFFDKVFSNKLENPFAENKER
jgi:hypothetical protein